VVNARKSKAEQNEGKQGSLKFEDIHHPMILLKREKIKTSVSKYIHDKPKEANEIDNGERA
jgi:DNA-binding cell septation regulator SpoVG